MTEQSDVDQQFIKWRDARIEALQNDKPVPEAPTEELAERARKLEADGIAWDHPWFPGLSRETLETLHGIFHEAYEQVLAQREKDSKRHPLVRAFLRVRGEILA